MLRIIALIALLFALPVHATTLVQLEFSDVVDTAELIFEGRVSSIQAQQSGPRTIHTIVRFEIIDVIKGDRALTELELRYLGGRVNGYELQVQSLHLPEVGEHGFYFVESLQTPLVHPLVGWSQGHFVVETDNSNQQIILTAERQLVTDIVTEPSDSQSSAVSAAVQTPAMQIPTIQTPAILGHDGSARGVLVQGLSSPAPAIRADHFRQIVREQIQRSSSGAGEQP